MRQRKAELGPRLKEVAEQCGYPDSVKMFHHLISLGWRRGWIATVFGIRLDMLSQRFHRPNPRHSREHLMKLARQFKDISV